MDDNFISPEKLKTLIDKGAAPRILDVRKRASFKESGLILPGANWRDPFAIAGWSAELKRGTPIVVYCVHGHEVSQDAGRTLRDAEFDARVLAGGFEAWREVGYELVPASDTEACSE